MANKVIVIFKTEKELKALDTIRALTFCRSNKTGILRMVESYNKIMTECSDLRTALQKMQDTK